jgi:hypothetical protein
VSEKEQSYNGIREPAISALVIADSIAIQINWHFKAMKVVVLSSPYTVLGR